MRRGRVGVSVGLRCVSAVDLTRRSRTWTAEETADTTNSSLLHWLSKIFYAVQPYGFKSVDARFSELVHVIQLSDFMDDAAITALVDHATPTCRGTRVYLEDLFTILHKALLHV